MTLPRLQSDVLGAIATGKPLAEIADIMCRNAEKRAPGTICSLLAVDPSGRLRPLAAPSLPASFSQKLNGLLIGPKTGSCGTSAYQKQPVEVTDIATDPLWEDFRSLALPLGLAACWSSPIPGSDGRIVATFAFYYRTKRGPTDIERRIVKTCVDLCSIAIEQTEIRERNDRLAYFDDLTGLPNRRRFDQMIALAPQGSGMGLLLIDIDYLKATNDTLGHVAGDELIREIGARLRNAVPAASAYRLSGDEFAVLVEGCTDGTCLGDAAAAILGQMVEPLLANGQTVQPSVTIGGAIYAGDGDDVGHLRQRADMALYHAKETNRGDWIQFDESLRTSISRRRDMTKRVDSALREGRVATYYQPVVLIQSGELVGLEALARIEYQGEIVSAGSFQGALGDRSVAVRLTDLMLDRIVRDVEEWLGQGIALRHVGINLSSADFSQTDVEQRIVAAFEAHGVPLKHVILEVTETVFLDGAIANIAEALQRLRKRGVRVSLDDFGTGYASLTHLLTLPVDIIKIDKSFIERLASDVASGVIVEGVISMAKKLNMKIVAEGIETSAQANWLLDLGCELGQGYYFARPADFATTTALLLRQPAILPIEPTRQLVDASGLPLSTGMLGS